MTAPRLSTEPLNSATYEGASKATSARVGGAADSAALHDLLRELRSYLEQQATNFSYSGLPHKYEPVAALPLAIPVVAGISVLDILAVGTTAWAGATLAKNALGQQLAINNMMSSLANRLQWTNQQLSVARNQLTQALNTVSASISSGPRAELLSTMQLQRQAAAGLLHTLNTLQHRFSSSSAPARPAPAKAPRPRVKQALQPTPPAVSMTITQRSAPPLTATATQHPYSPLTRPETRLSFQPRPIPASFSGFTQQTPVGQAMQAIAYWSASVQQLKQLRPDARDAQRELLAAMVMSTGQQLQQALRHPEIIQVMQAGGGGGAVNPTASGSRVGSASATPNGQDPNENKKLRQRLIEAMINVGGSLGGDVLEHATGGRPLSADRMATGAVIAASLGFALPPGVRGLVKGSLVNGLGSAAETGLRQLSGADPHDALAILASFVFSTGATAGLHGVGRFVSPLPNSKLQVLTRGAKNEPAARAGSHYALPARPPNFDVFEISPENFHAAMRQFESLPSPVSEPQYKRPAEPIFENLFRGLGYLGTYELSNLDLAKLSRRLQSNRSGNFLSPPSPRDFANSPNFSSPLRFETRYLLLHDWHLLFSGFRNSPATVILGENLLGRGGESSLFAKLSLGYTLPRDGTLEDVTQYSLAHLESYLDTLKELGFQRNQPLEIPDNHFSTLFGNPDDPTSLRRAINQAYTQGWFADGRYADYLNHLIHQLDDPKTRRPALDQIVANLNSRLKQDIGPISISSVLAELQLFQAFCAYRLKTAGNSFSSDELINLKLFYQYYISLHDTNQLTTAEQIRGLLKQQNIPYSP